MRFSVVTGLNEFRAPYRPHSARSAGAAAQRGVSILRPPPARRWRCALRGVPAIAAPSRSQQRWQGGGHALATIGAYGPSRISSTCDSSRSFFPSTTMKYRGIAGREPALRPVGDFEVPDWFVVRLVTAPVHATWQICLHRSMLTVRARQEGSRGEPGWREGKRLFLTNLACGGATRRDADAKAAAPPCPDPRRARSRICPAVRVRSLARSCSRVWPAAARPGPSASKWAGVRPDAGQRRRGM
jgi:hypothetical protein